MATMQTKSDAQRRSHICEDVVAGAAIDSAASVTSGADLTGLQRDVAMSRRRLLDPILERMRTGSSRSAAVAWFYQWLPSADPAMQELAARLARVVKRSKHGRLGKHRRQANACLAPTRATLMRWLAQFDEGGVAALAPKYGHQSRKDYGWEARALALYNQPAKPTIAAVADWLRQEGFASATEGRVRHYIGTLPATHGPHGKARTGSNEYRLKSNFVMRSFATLPVGFCYQGDGHCMDVYVAHPRTGRAWRPELTVWLDVKSRYIVGWYLSEAESSYSTLFSLSAALLEHDHVPAVLHIDNGAGFKSKMMNDSATGFYERMGISTTFTIPGNPRGKGQVERFFRTLEERFGKRWPTFCGKDMAQEVRRKLVDHAAKQKIKMPTLPEFSDALGQWIERYNNTPHSGLQGATPASVWAGLERVALELPEAAVIRPREMKTVNRFMVRLHNRFYQHAELAAYEKSKVVVEYDLHHDDVVWVRDDKDRLICKAELVHKKEYLPASRIAEYQQRRLEGQAKRLEQRLAEHEARAGMHDDIDNTEDFTALTQGMSQLLHEGFPPTPFPSEAPEAGGDALLERSTLTELSAEQSADEPIDMLMASADDMPVGLLEGGTLPSSVDCYGTEHP